MPNHRYAEGQQVKIMGDNYDGDDSRKGMVGKIVEIDFDDKTLKVEFEDSDDFWDDSEWFEFSNVKRVRENVERTKS